MGGEDGGGAAPTAEAAAAPAAATAGGQTGADSKPAAIDTKGTAPEHIKSPASIRANTPNPFSRRNTSLDLDDYFTGPRDIQKHSKWPMFMQMHGSILPKLILPLLAVALWTTWITIVHMKVVKIGISSILLTVLGFVVGLGLSFRSSTAYERYAEGRRYWATLILTSQNLARVYWTHAVEREGELGKKDLLAKLTALNLIVAYAVALKHKLRFEPYTNYHDIEHLVAHLDTFAAAATREDPDNAQRAFKKSSFFKSIGEYLGVSFAESNPRKVLKRANRPIGNLPLEILNYLGAFTDELVQNGQLTIAMHQTMAYNQILALNDVLTGTERVLNTPLPIAYSIAIAQITWVYILLLPFQLLTPLEWITIPATVAAAYIILGILFIGREIENPFGQDVNDLPLEAYCTQIAAEMDITASRKKRKNAEWIESVDNRVFWPLSNSGYPVWMNRDIERIRETVIHKVETNFDIKTGLDTADHGHDKKAHNGKVVVDNV